MRGRCARLNIEHPTSNAQHPTIPIRERIPAENHSMLDVECWTLDVRPAAGASHRATDSRTDPAWFAVSRSLILSAPLPLAHATAAALPPVVPPRVPRGTRGPAD